MKHYRIFRFCNRALQYFLRLRKIYIHRSNTTVLESVSLHTFTAQIQRKSHRRCHIFATRIYTYRLGTGELAHNTGYSVIKGNGRKLRRFKIISQSILNCAGLPGPGYKGTEGSVLQSGNGIISGLLVELWIFHQVHQKLRYKAEIPDIRPGCLIRTIRSVQGKTARIIELLDIPAIRQLHTEGCHAFSQILFQHGVQRLYFIVIKHLVVVIQNQRIRCIRHTVHRIFIGHTTKHGIVVHGTNGLQCRTAELC